jgi:hypothetical protein
VVLLAPTEFSWTFKNKPNHYLLQIARDSAFNDVVFEHRTELDKVTIQQSFGQGRFYWRVVAVSGEKSIELSDTRLFTR